MKAGIQAIIQKINADAEEHGAAQYAQIKNNIDAEISSGNKIYSDDFAKRREMLKKHNELEYARLLERLSSRLYREVLSYQHNLINEIFDMAAEKLKNAPPEEFAEMFKSVIKNLKGSYVLYLGEYSVNKLGEAEIAKIIKRRRTIEIALSEEFIPHKSGFILSDDRVEYNCLFEDLIEDKKSRQTALIMQELFGDISKTKENAKGKG